MCPISNIFNYINNGTSSREVDIVDQVELENLSLTVFEQSPWNSKDVIGTSHSKSLYARYLCSHDALGLKAKRGARR